MCTLIRFNKLSSCKALTLSRGRQKAAPLVSTQLFFSAVAGAGPRLIAPPADRPLPSAASRSTPAPVGASGSFAGGGTARFPRCDLGGGDPGAPRAAVADCGACQDPGASAEIALALCAASTSGCWEGGAGAAAACSDRVRELLLSLSGVHVPCAAYGDPAPCKS